MSIASRIQIAWVVLLLASCGKTEDEGPPPSLEVPYAIGQEADVRVDNVFVSPGYSGGGAPFGTHSGIHFSPTTAFNSDLPYYAMADGTIDRIETYVSGVNYNVNVHLKMSGGVTAIYQFETNSASGADLATQLSLIAVSEGQAVTRGQLIGTLFDAGTPIPMMHLGILDHGELICPTLYMSPAAAARTSALIVRDNPAWLPCYED